MRRILALFYFLVLLSSFSMHVFAEEKGSSGNFDYTNPEFKATVDMLYMEGHSNDDLANCDVKQLYYEEVADMFFINGMSKKEILDYYLKAQGVHALNAPPEKGFNLSLWITPFLLILIISILLFFVIKKWKGNKNIIASEVSNSTDLEHDIYASIIDQERKKFY